MKILGLRGEDRTESGKILIKEGVAAEKMVESCRNVKGH